MNAIFLVTAAVLLGFAACIWSAEGLMNIAIKMAYMLVSVWAAGLAVNALGWLA